MDVPEYQPCREDYTPENWARLEWECCWPIELEEGFDGAGGAGRYGELLGAVIGRDLFEYEITWPLGHLRKTNRLDRVQYRTAYRAVAFANCLGKVMDSRVDIALATVGMKSDLDKMEAQKEVLNRLHRWFDDKGETAMVLYVQERGPVFGLHSHITLHVPPALRKPFKKFVPEMLERVVKRPLARGTIRTERVRVRRGSPWGTDYQSQGMRLSYVMKGLKRDAGWVAGKRMGVSRAIDRTAQVEWLKANGLPLDMLDPPAVGARMDDRHVRFFRENWDTMKPK